MKPISPKTKSQYSYLLTRAFGVAEPPFQLAPARLKDWGSESKKILRCAVRRAYLDAGLPIEAAEKVNRSIVLDFRPTLIPKIPTEAQSKLYEQAARSLPNPGMAALALLPLALGLRAEEVVTLTRESVRIAADEGILKVFRKGAEEQLLPAKPYKELFTALLASPAKAGGPWRIAGDIISAAGTTHGKYVALWRHVKSVAKTAGISTRPHALRHLFATRMIVDGAPLPVVQKMLNHKRIATTERYLHLTPAVAEQYLRPL